MGESKKQLKIGSKKALNYKIKGFQKIFTNHHLTICLCIFVEFAPFLMYI